MIPSVAFVCAMWMTASTSPPAPDLLDSLASPLMQTIARRPTRLREKSRSYRDTLAFPDLQKAGGSMALGSAAKLAQAIAR